MIVLGRIYWNGVISLASESVLLFITKKTRY